MYEKQSAGLPSLEVAVVAISYEPCGCGPSGATLHYGHAGAPNDRQCAEGDMLLLDMGTELRCYCCDITCSFPVTADGKFTPDQRLIFDTVGACQVAVMHAMRPGVSWASMHELSYRVICERLTAAGLLRGRCWR